MTTQEMIDRLTAPPQPGHREGFHVKRIAKVTLHWNGSEWDWEQPAGLSTYVEEAKPKAAKRV